MSQSYLELAGFTPATVKEDIVDLTVLMDEDKTEEDDFVNLALLMSDKRTEVDMNTLRKVEELLTKYRINAEVNTIVGATRDYFVITPNNLDEVAKLIAPQPTKLIESKVGLGATIETSGMRGDLVLSIEAQDKTPLNIGDYYYMGTPNTLKIAIGEVVGELLVLELFKKMPHLAIVGTSGSGKSEQFISIIQAIQKNFKDNISGLRMAFISPKHDSNGADFRMFEDSPFQLPEAFVYEGYSDIDEMLDKTRLILESFIALKDEMKRQQIKSEDITTTHILCFDEMEYLLAPETDEMSAAAKKLAVDAVLRDDKRNYIIYLLGQLGRVGRSYKIHMLLATQSPRAAIFRPLKTNLAIMSGKVTTIDEEKIVGYTGGIARNLDGQGHFVHTRGTQIEYVQGFMYDRDFCID